jgi:hypothetical protein
MVGVAQQEFNFPAGFGLSYIFQVLDGGFRVIRLERRGRCLLP